MKGMLIASGGFLIIGIILILMIFNSVTKTSDSLKKEYEPEIGKQFILDKDTLTIVDYSTLEESFILSNGKKVNKSLILNKK